MPEAQFGEGQDAKQGIVTRGGAITVNGPRQDLRKVPKYASWQVADDPGLQAEQEVHRGWCRETWRARRAMGGGVVGAEAHFVSFWAGDSCGVGSQVGGAVCQVGDSVIVGGRGRV